MGDDANPLTDVEDVHSLLAATMNRLGADWPEAAMISPRCAGATELPDVRMRLELASFELLVDPAAYVDAGASVSVAEDALHKVATVAWLREMQDAGYYQTHRDDFASRPEVDELLADEHVALHLGGEIVATEPSLSSNVPYGLNQGTRMDIDRQANSVAASYLGWAAWDRQAEPDAVLDPRLARYGGIVDHVLRRYAELRSRLPNAATDELGELALLARDEGFGFLRGLSILPSPDDVYDGE
jgi:hypothetical protein